MSEQLGITHPYLLCDVEVYNRDSVCDLRDDVHKVAKSVWREEAIGKDESVQEIDFPEVAKGREKVDLRVELLAVQKKDPFCRSAIIQLGSIIDSSRSRRNKWVAEAVVEPAVLRPVEPRNPLIHQRNGLRRRLYSKERSPQLSPNTTDFRHSTSR